MEMLFQASLDEYILIMNTEYFLLCLLTEAPPKSKINTKQELQEV